MTDVEPDATGYRRRDMQVQRVAESHPARRPDKAADQPAASETQRYGRRDLTAQD